MDLVWLPDSLHRLKPLFLMLLGAILLYVSKFLILTLLAMIIMLYALWILHVRFVSEEERPLKELIKRKRPRSFQSINSA